MANPAKKAKALVVRLSAIEHRRVNAEAARRGLTVADLTRSLLRVACGALPVERGALECRPDPPRGAP